MQLAGIKVNPSEYQRLQFVITNERQAGARFTRADIRDLIQNARHPDKSIEKTVDKLDESMRNDE